MQAYNIVVVENNEILAEEDKIYKNKDSAIESASQCRLECRKISVTENGTPLCNAPEFALCLVKDNVVWIRAALEQHNAEIQVRVVDLVQSDVVLDCPDHGAVGALQLVPTDTVVWRAPFQISPFLE